MGTLELKLHVKPDSTDWKKKAQWRRDNRNWLHRSQEIALSILRALEDQKMQQKELAILLGVSPQQVSKWVKGKENFTLETISRIEDVLDINLIQLSSE